MINFIFNKISNLKLTVMQYVLLSLSAVIGVLLVALRLKGSKLHQAQVDLLLSHSNAEAEKAAEKTASAKERYKKALKSYKEEK